MHLAVRYVSQPGAMESFARRSETLVGWVGPPSLVLLLLLLLLLLLVLLLLLLLLLQHLRLLRLFSVSLVAVIAQYAHLCSGRQLTAVAAAILFFTVVD